jgi:hypothetical protein
VGERERKERRHKDRKRDRKNESKNAIERKERELEGA